MGLIKAAASAIGETFHDQWKEVIACEDMNNDILMMGKTTDTGAITKNSIIRVMPGQCATNQHLHHFLLEILQQYLKKCGKDLLMVVEFQINKLFTISI